MEAIFTAENLVALLTLTALEIVLGIDNIVFISILTGRLPEGQRPKARRLGLAVALLSRIVLLLTLGWVMALDKPLFTVPGEYIFWTPGSPTAHGAAPAHGGAATTLGITPASPDLAQAAPLAVTGHERGLPISVKDLILLAGGLFLLVKATLEIHHKIEGGESPAGEHPDPARHLENGRRGAAAYASVLAQIMLIDIVFSLDSIITAIGMAKDVRVMVAAVIVAVVVMLVFVNRISDFVERHPTVKMLALSFLILIGVVLVAEGFHQHVGKGYIYFAMAFSLAVEMLNLRMRRAQSKAIPAT